MRWRRTEAIVQQLRPLAAVLTLVAVGVLAGCTREPVVVSSEALGTVVSVTAYGDDDARVRAAIEDAYDAMAQVESELDAYEPNSAVSRFNAQPYDGGELPPDAVAVLDTIDALGVGDAFSPRLLAASRLYDFEDSGTVPPSADLALAVRASSEFLRIDENHAAFVRIESTDARLDVGGKIAPALDFGGAAKGLALDRAREALRASGAVSAAIITSGSSTVTLGTKPDGSVWRIGIEDPRDTKTVVATFAFEADGALSTSGDYQRYFVADDVRYHHVLDPATGQPARGVRSLTVAGSKLSGLDSDILSTALFVRGAGAAAAYASEHGMGLYLVNDEGRARVVPAPERSGLSVAEVATPKSGD